MAPKNTHKGGKRASKGGDELTSMAETDTVAMKDRENGSVDAQSSGHRAKRRWESTHEFSGDLIASTTSVGRKDSTAVLMRFLQRYRYYRADSVPFPETHLVQLRLQGCSMRPASTATSRECGS